ncbi:hypothetical protein E1293_14340 [Actinomadura darangshiensis]|uniref:Uncharacterized protein n=1 Tax=Actinomadura darangshiensis TaxID=705336 RepID=A0A4R5BDE5_9ACTN|nr:hypothetical protein [Actinomadura darangshiensis]TDD83595.1 hypothetical protein E1293_14340 [Actinomadura darangshiensis]
MATLVKVWDDLPGTERVLIGGRTLTFRRSPADGPVSPPCDEHIVAGPDETSPAWLTCADVIVCGTEDPERLRRAHPGCLVVVAVARRGCLVAAGDLEARLDPVLGGTCTADDAAMAASALHTWLVTGGPPGALARLTLVRGNTVTVVRMRDRRAARPGTRRVAL